MSHTFQKFSIYLVVFLTSWLFTSKASGQIVYSSNPGGFNNGGTPSLMYHELSTEKSKLLLKGKVAGRGVYNAAFAYDGKSLVFNTYRFSGWKLGKADYINGEIANIKKFTSRSHYEYKPKFSQSDQKVVYQEFQWGTNKRLIRLADADGQNSEMLTEISMSDQKIDWIMNDQSIVFTDVSKNQTSIFSLNIKSKVKKNLTAGMGNCFAVSSSKLENKIAFLSDKNEKIDLYVLDLNDGSSYNLTPKLKSSDARSGDLWAYATDWSPDGNQLVFNVFIDGDFEVFVINQDGSDLIQLTKNNDTDICPTWVGGY